MGRQGTDVERETREKRRAANIGRQRPNAYLALTELTQEAQDRASAISADRSEAPALRFADKFLQRGHGLSERYATPLCAALREQRVRRSSASPTQRSKLIESTQPIIFRLRLVWASPSSVDKRGEITVPYFNGIL